MMDSRPVRNMQSTLSNKCEKLCISLAFIIRIYHDARSSECQISHITSAESKLHFTVTFFLVLVGNLQFVSSLIPSGLPSETKHNLSTVRELSL